ncbi:hypothetical protein [Rhizobium sp. BR 362]|uniref:hypothetical protein n=1 Tax=Rhizobium sp. BR 362 TaxID=3040670 RepID=UPI002F40DFF2
MEKHLKQIEAILGGKFERLDSRVIPGTVPVEGTAFLYFADDRKNAFRKQFRNLTEYTNPPYAKFGGVNERGCKITLPGGDSFYAIGYHGDLDGWRKDIEAGAQAQHVLLAKIEGSNILVSDGRTVPLSECSVEFT